MPKILFIFAAIVGATLLGSGPSAAVEGRYCAVVFNGEGAVKEICHFNSFEACRLEVTGGNRGTCGNNPRWAGAQDEAPLKRKQRRH